MMGHRSRGESVPITPRSFRSMLTYLQTFVFPHLEIGSEAQWNVLLGGYQPNGLGVDYVKFFLGIDDWNFYDFSYDIIELADRIQPGNATADDFDISSFHARGGKLLQYHGQADGLIPTGSSEYYYKQVYKTLGSQGLELNSWYRFFLVPGMQHCQGTPAAVKAPWYFAGGNQAAQLGTGVSGVPGFRDADHDALLALMQWTENDKAPERIVATAWVNDTLQDEVFRQRPLCPYPRIAKFDGMSDPNKADSWSCEDPYGLKTQSSG